MYATEFRAPVFLHLLQETEIEVMQ